MKEKDLVKVLDNLIIDGLIKEAEQDNADFEAAMRKMSDKEFEEIIYGPVYADADENMASDVAAEIFEDRIFEPAYADADEKMAPEVAAEIFEDRSHEPTCFHACADINVDLASKMAANKPMVYSEDRCTPARPFVEKRLKWQVFRPWITSAVAAAAVVLIVLIPSVNAMNGKLCDSALYASTAYITSSRSAHEITMLKDEKLKAILPELERRYNDCVKKDGKFPYYTEDLQEAGWDLTLAYLRLHKKGDAVKVLKVLLSQYNGTPFGDHCKKMLDQL